MIKIYGPIISTYVRIVAMCAEEADTAYEVIPTAANAPEHRERHPYARVPSAEIDGENLFETIAICQYIDDRYNNALLQPSEPLQRARMHQWISVANQYFFPTTERGLVLPRLVVPLTGGTADETLVKKALPYVAHQLRLVEERLAQATFFAGPRFSLADLFFYPMLKAVQLTPEGRLLLNALPRAEGWLEIVGVRPSSVATQWPGEPVQAKG